jgi:hypothetical protein
MMCIQSAVPLFIGLIMGKKRKHQPDFQLTTSYSVGQCAIYLEQRFRSGKLTQIDAETWRFRLENKTLKYDRGRNNWSRAHWIMYLWVQANITLTKLPPINATIIQVHSRLHPLTYFLSSLLLLVIAPLFVGLGIVFAHLQPRLSGLYMFLLVVLVCAIFLRIRYLARKSKASLIEEIRFALSPLTVDTKQKGAGVYPAPMTSKR